jgi:hypothetical protein
MTTHAEMLRALNQVFVTNWVIAGTARTAYTFTNVDLGATAEWCKFHVEDGLGGQETMGSTGNRSFERRGTLVAEIHVRPDEGTAHADALGKVITDAFEGKTISGVHLLAATKRHLGPFKRWHKMVVRIPLTYYERK